MRIRFRFERWLTCTSHFTIHTLLAEGSAASGLVDRHNPFDQIVCFGELLGDSLSDLIEKYTAY